MGPPSESKERNLEALLSDDSMDGGIVQGAEESFDFNPPEAMSAHAAATGFDAEFTDTVVHEEKKQAAAPKQV